MERLTHKHNVFDYVLPEQNVVGDNQATEISLGETEYTCKKYIIGEAINKLGELEDVLESWYIENLEELKTRLNDCQVYHLKNNSNETLIHNLKNELADLEAKLVEKDKVIETIPKENEELVIKHNVYNLGNKIQKDKVYSLTGEALELLINRQNQKAIEQLAEQTYPVYKREHQRRAYLENIEVPRLKKENQQLKQSQKQLAISELEKLKKYNRTLALRGRPYIDIFINNQIKELKGEETI